MTCTIYNPICTWHIALLLNINNKRSSELLKPRTAYRHRYRHIEQHLYGRPPHQTTLTTRRRPILYNSVRSKANCLFCRTTNTNAVLLDSTFISHHYYIAAVDRHINICTYSYISRAGSKACVCESRRYVLTLPGGSPCRPVESQTVAPRLLPALPTHPTTGHPPKVTAEARGSRSSRLASAGPRLIECLPTKDFNLRFLGWSRSLKSSWHRWAVLSCDPPS